MEFKVIYSAPHDFLFHPEYHPDRIGEVAMEGWRCVMECSMDGLSARAEVCLGLGKVAVESIARDLSMQSWIAEFESAKNPL